MDSVWLIYMNWKVQRLQICGVSGIKEKWFSDEWVRAMKLGGYPDVSCKCIICTKPLLQLNLLGSITYGVSPNNITNQR